MNCIMTLELLEKLSNRKRTMRWPVDDEYVKEALRSKPYAFWPMDEMWGPAARDISANKHAAAYEPGVAFFLPGRTSADTDYPERGPRRAALFAGGGRMVADVPSSKDYSVELWLWNGIAEHVRELTGYVFGTADAKAPDVAGDQLYLDTVKEDKAGGVCPRLFKWSRCEVFRQNTTEAKDVVSRGPREAGRQGLCLSKRPS